MKKIKFKVESLGGDKEFEVESSNLPLLDEMEKGKARMPFGCRSGSCGVCRIVVHEGLENLAERSIVEEDTFLRCRDPENIRLACQAVVKESSPDQIHLKISIAPEVEIKD